MLCGGEGFHPRGLIWVKRHLTAAAELSLQSAEGSTLTCPSKTTSADPHGPGPQDQVWKRVLDLTAPSLAKPAHSETIHLPSFPQL